MYAIVPFMNGFVFIHSPVAVEQPKHGTQTNSEDQDRIPHSAKANQVYTVCTDHNNICQRYNKNKINHIPLKLKMDLTKSEKEASTRYYHYENQTIQIY